MSVKSKAKAPVLKSLADLAGAPDLKATVSATTIAKRKDAIKAGIRPSRPAEERIKSVKAAQSEVLPSAFVQSQSNATAKPDNATVYEVESEESPPEKILVDVSIPEGETAKTTFEAPTALSPIKDALNNLVDENGLDLGEGLNVPQMQLAETDDAGDVIVASKAEAEERQQLIDDLLSFELRTKRHENLREVYHRLATTQLRDMLDLLKAEWGGSGAFKKFVLDIEDRINKSANNAMTKKRIAALRLRHKEYHALATKVEKAMGSDTVIQGMKHTAYHKLLEVLVKDHALLANGIREMAEAIAFDMEVGEVLADDGFTPANTPELIKILVYVGTSAKRWMITADEAKKRIREAELQRDKLLQEVKSLSASIKFERERYNTRESELRNKAHRRFGARFALVNGDGMFLGRIPDTKGINPETLEMVGNIGKAMILNEESQVELVFDKLRAWSRPDSKYRKVMKRKGLHPDYLDKVEITLTRV